MARLYRKNNMKTTKEKIKLVEEYLKLKEKTDLKYYKFADRHNISHYAFRSWLIKYQDDGPNGLKSGTGKKKTIIDIEKKVKELLEREEDIKRRQKEIEKKQAEIDDLQEFLKKFNAFYFRDQNYKIQYVPLWQKKAIQKFMIEWSEFHKLKLSKSRMCQLMKIDYKTLYYKTNNDFQKYQKWLDKIMILWNREQGTIGYHRLHLHLVHEFNFPFSKKITQNLMRILNLWSRNYKKVIKPYDPKNTAKESAQPNYLRINKQCPIKDNKAIASDVTYLKVNSNYQSHFLYLIIIQDQKSGFINSFNFSFTQNINLWKRTLDNYLSDNKDINNLIFHSDNGSIYKNFALQKKITNKGGIISMSRVGKSVENAKVESFWKLLKSELYNHLKSYDYKHVIEKVSKWIRYYNYQRLNLRFNKTPYQIRKDDLGTFIDTNIYNKNLSNNYCKNYQNYFFQKTTNYTHFWF